MDAMERRLGPMNDLPSNPTPSNARAHLVERHVNRASTSTGRGRQRWSAPAAIAWVSASVVLTSACVCPPCPGAAEEAPVVAAGAVKKIWNGDTAGGGQGWADCDKKDACKASIKPVVEAGVDGSMGLKFSADGPQWLGGGWNWFGWWPETAGTDISGYKTLVFDIKVVAESPNLLPEPGAVNITLGCSNGKKNSADISVQKYQKDFLDGEWHQVKIPLSELTKGSGRELDLRTAWEFRISTWAANKRTFDIYLDNIAVEN